MSKSYAIQPQRLAAKRAFTLCEPHQAERWAVVEITKVSRYTDTRGTSRLITSTRVLSSHCTKAEALEAKHRIIRQQAPAKHKLARVFAFGKRCPGRLPAIQLLAQGALFPREK